MLTDLISLLTSEALCRNSLMSPPSFSSAGILSLTISHSSAPSPAMRRSRPGLKLLKGNLPDTEHLCSTLSSPPSLRSLTPLANTSQTPSPSTQCFRATIPPLWCLSPLLNNLLVKNFCSRSVFGVRSELRLRSLWYLWQFMFLVLNILDGKLILSKSSDPKKLQDETSRSKFTSDPSFSCSTRKTPTAALLSDL